MFSVFFEFFFFHVWYVGSCRLQVLCFSVYVLCMLQYVISGSIGSECMQFSQVLSFISFFLSVSYLSYYFVAVDFVCYV